MTALTLLKEEDFPSLGCLLEREFRPLSRLLVLLGWTHCQSLRSAKMLLQTLHRTQVTLTLQLGLLQKWLLWGFQLRENAGSWYLSWSLTPDAWVSIFLLSQHRTEAVTSSSGMPVMGYGLTWRSWSGVYSRAGTGLCSQPPFHRWAHWTPMFCVCDHFKTSST